MSYRAMRATKIIRMPKNTYPRFDNAYGSPTIPTPKGPHQNKICYFSVQLIQNYCF